jgi:hypothetical protein
MQRSVKYIIALFSANGAPSIQLATASSNGVSTPNAFGGFKAPDASRRISSQGLHRNESRFQRLEI